MPSAIYPSLKGKRVVVTGGATGIGAATVEAFARQGSKVAFLDVNEEEGKKLEAKLKSGNGVKFHRCDLMDLSAITRTFASVGPVDVLVNNAANDGRHRLSDVTPEFWDKTMSVNLRHLLFCAQAVVPGMKDAKGGVIINFGSSSWHLGLPDLALYETAKAGIEGMTRALARELGGDNIRVTAIIPGNVQTPRQAQWYKPKDEEEIVAQQCLKSRIQPEDVASLVLFLASDDARMCTGRSYWIDAGWR